MADADIPELIREYMRAELQGVYTVQLVLVEAYDHATRRATIALKDDPTVKTDRVPVAVPLAGPDYGDHLPITPGETEGLAVFSRVPLDDLLERRGEVYSPQHRHHSYEDALFFPGQVFYDDDDPPDYGPDTRVIAHPSGVLITLDATGFAIDHPDGLDLAATTAPYTDAEADALDAAAADPATVFPPRESGIVRLRHPAGPDIVVHEHGLSIERGTMHPDTDEPQGRLTLGAPTDPDHIELDTHRHLVPHDDGTYSVTGPPLTHRETFRYLLDSVTTADLANPLGAGIAAAQSLYAHWQTWLESVTGQAVAADGSDLPDPEPVPTARERDQFDGTIAAKPVEVPLEVAAATRGPYPPSWEF